jgi:hypothetical protein
MWIMKRQSAALYPWTWIWKFHTFSFNGGGAQMLTYDVDGDGDNDVVLRFQIDTIKRVGFHPILAQSKGA